jgi:hypothetical protein
MEKQKMHIKFWLRYLQGLLERSEHVLDGNIKMDIRERNRLCRYEWNCTSQG